MKNTDLDIAAPEQLPVILRNAAQAYRESVGELQSSWQDDGAGLIWGKLASVLDEAADRAEKKLAKAGYSKAQGAGVRE